MHNLDPEGLDPYPKEMPTWAMVKYAAYTLSKIDPWLEGSVSVQWRTENPPEAGHPAPRRLLGPRRGRLIKPPEELTPRGDQDRPTERQ
jgi:hypothetical protein